MNIRARIFGGDEPPEQPIFQAKEPKGAKADELRSVAVQRHEQRRVDGRLEDRHRLASETVRITHAGSEHDAELINVSGGGAMVESDIEPMLWDKVELHLGPHGTIECGVLWVRDGRIGLEFAHETRLDCAAGEQASVLREVIARSFPEAQLDERADSDAASASEPAPAADENRQAARHPLIWSGVLHHDFQSTPVRLRNVSRTGAMIESPSPVRVGAEPLLEIGDAGSVSATVEWVCGDQVGLKFQQPFDMALLAKAQPEVTPQRWVPPAYLSRAGRATSLTGDQWGRLSLGELSSELEGFLKR